MSNYVSGDKVALILDLDKARARIAALNAQVGRDIGRFSATLRDTLGEKADAEATAEALADALEWALRIIEDHVGHEYLAQPSVDEALGYDECRAALARAGRNQS